jgi:hypothetical protein
MAYKVQRCLFKLLSGAFHTVKVDQLYHRHDLVNLNLHLACVYELKHSFEVVCVDCRQVYFLVLTFDKLAIEHGAKRF